MPAATAVVPLRQVAVLSYVLALREGGSLPGLMEADDFGTYVVKFRGAGQGPRALVASTSASTTCPGCAPARPQPA